MELETGVHRKLSELVNSGKISNETKRTVIGNLALAEDLNLESIAKATQGVENASGVQMALNSLLRDPLKEVAPPSPVPETPISVASEVKKTTQAEAILEKADLYDTIMGVKTASTTVEEVLKKAAAVLELEKKVA